MKKLFKLSYVLLAIAMIFTSCRQEDEEIIDPPVEQAIEANSAIATLLRNVAQNDGSMDNIIDGASCFDIQLPVTVIVNGVEVEVTTEDDYDLIEDILEQSDTDTDNIDIIFPITIIFNDYTTAAVNSLDELLAFAAQCPDENSDDDDIECIDIQYPITATIFNANNEEIDTIVINSDEQLYDFVEDLDDFAAVTIDFPITVILADGTTTQVTTIQELEVVIENAENTCDEDDDNDYNDDDCPDCTTNQLTDVLTNCDEWFIDSLERNDIDLEDQFTSYSFVFNTDGTLDVSNNGVITNGTWSATGDGNEIQVVITVPGLNDVNDTWNLNEIELEDGAFEIELLKGEDELEFRCGSNDDDDDDDDDDDNDDDDDTEDQASGLIDALTADNSLWIVSLFQEGNENETSDYNGFVFEFDTAGNVTVSGAENSNGVWSSLNNGTEMLLDFGPEEPLEELNDEDWEVVSINATEIQLRDTGDTNDPTDLLTFTKL